MSTEPPLPEVVLIMGPTASGKTDLAISLAERFPVSIISVDSAMVYRGLDVGTGKPEPAVLARYPHALIDILDPAQTYSAGQFRTHALAHIADAHRCGLVPVLVGGTMLYFKALTHGLAALPEAQPEVRAQIDAEAGERGWPEMHHQLAQVDPRSAARIQSNDSQRIQRALEVFRISGKTLSEWHASGSTPPPPFRFHSYAWSPSERQVLHERIERRFMQMMARGFLAEVQRLYARDDLGPHLPSIRSVGYRQLWEHLAGAYPLHEGVRRGIVATRHLARRQLIWLRGMGNLIWLNSLEPTALDDIYNCIEHARQTMAQY